MVTFLFGCEEPRFGPASLNLKLNSSLRLMLCSPAQEITRGNFRFRQRVVVPEKWKVCKCRFNFE